MPMLPSNLLLLGLASPGVLFANGDDARMGVRGRKRFHRDDKRKSETGVDALRPDTQFRALV